MCVFLCTLSQFHVHWCERSRLKLAHLEYLQHIVWKTTQIREFSPVFFFNIYQSTASKQNKNLSILSLSTLEGPMLEYYWRIHMDSIGSSCTDHRHIGETQADLYYDQIYRLIKYSLKDLIMYLLTEIYMNLLKETVSKGYMVNYWYSEGYGYSYISCYYYEIP